MSNSKTIIKNIFSLSLASVFMRIINAVVGIVLARYFSLSDYGSYQTAFAFVGLFGVISDLGISQMMVRDGARNEEKFNKLINNALGVEIVFSIITFLILYLCTLLTSYENRTILFIVIIATSQILIDSTLNPIFLAVFQVKKKLHYWAYSSILFSFITTLFIFIFILLKLDIIAFIFIFPIVSILSAILKKILTRTHYKIEFNWTIIKYIITQSLPFGLSIIAAQFYLQSGTVILSLILTEKETGTFSAVFKLILITYTIPSVIYSSFMNKMFSYGNSKKYELSNYLNKLFYFLCPIGIFLSLNFYYFASDIVHFLYNGKFIDAIFTLKLLSFLIVLEFINYPPSTLLTFIDKQKVKVIIQIIIAILNIVLNIVLINIFGLVGVALAILTTDIIKNILWYICSYLFGYSIETNKKYILIFIAIFAMLAVYKLLYGKLHFIVLGLIGTAVYFSILYIFKYFKFKNHRNKLVPSEA